MSKENRPWKNSFNKPNFPVHNVEDNKPEEVTVPKEEENIHNTNYLNLGKEKEENLNINGMIFKHGSITKCNMLNFREKPNKGALVIGTFNNGDDILYTETNDPDWFMLKGKDGKIGYCMSEFIKIEV